MRWDLWPETNKAESHCQGVMLMTRIDINYR